MKEHIIFDKIETYKAAVANKPLSLLPNILLLTYLALGKRYEELLAQAEQFLMNNTGPITIVEDYNLMGNIALNRKKETETVFQNILSADPEDSYAYLLFSLVNHDKKNLQLGWAFSEQNNRKTISEIINHEIEIEKQYKFYRIPDIIGIKDNVISKIKTELEEEHSNQVLKVSLSNALLKLGQVDEAEKELKSIISIYPNYTRALYYYAKIESDYNGHEEEGIRLFKKIFSLNPVSQYLKGIEVIFLSEKDEILENELKNIFKTNNPFIDFFREHYKKMKDTKEQNKKKEVREEIPKIETSSDPLEKGFEKIENNQFKEAIEYFLKELKKKQ